MFEIDGCFCLVVESMRENGVDRSWKDLFSLQCTDCWEDISEGKDLGVAIENMFVFMLERDELVSKGKA